MPRWVLSVDYVGAHTLNINRPLDVDPPSPIHSHGAGPGSHRASGQLHASLLDLVVSADQLTCNPNTATNPQPPYAAIQADVNDGYLYYDALDVNLPTTSVIAPPCC